MFIWNEWICLSIEKVKYEKCIRTTHTNYNVEILFQWDDPYKICIIQSFLLTANKQTKWCAIYVKFLMMFWSHESREFIHTNKTKYFGVKMYGVAFVPRGESQKKRMKNNEK